MATDVMCKTEDRETVTKFQQFMNNIRQNYDVDKARDLERKIEADAKKTKKRIKVLGTAATVILLFCPADGPFGEICTALATPGLCKLVDICADIKKKALITGKRGFENKILHVDGSDPNIKGYDFTNGEVISDVKEALKDYSECKGVLSL